jgi:acetyl esterase
MTLHPGAKKLLEDASASDQPNSHLLPIERARENFEALFGSLPRQQEIAGVRDLSVPVSDGATVSGRLYNPALNGRLPLIVFFHGGGFQMGSLDSHDELSRAVANAAGASVLSVAYRRPPEAKFPTAPRDCFDAVSWAVANEEVLGVDGTRLALAGDSAGGNLAAAVALLARDEDGPAVSAVGLFYPATTWDLNIGFNMDYEGWVLFRDEVLWHKDAYFVDQHADSHSPYAAPLGADLSGFPPTCLVTAKYDPLGRMGDLFAQALKAAGVKTDYTQYDGMIHGFAQFPTIFDDASSAIEQVSMFIADHL